MNVEQCCGGKHCPLETNPMKWSILICTLKERQEKFMQLTAKIMEQIKRNHLENEIEVIYLSDSFFDKNKLSIGAKRNHLIDAANGEYVSFVDDDDDVSAMYVTSIYDAIKKDPDVVGIRGIMTFNGSNPRTFIHSLKYDHYFEEKNVYYRCPNHLNPMKKEIAKTVRFGDKNHAEDTDFALKLNEMKLLKKEEYINNALYFYKYKRKAIYK